MALCGHDSLLAEIQRLYLRPSSCSSASPLIATSSTPFLAPLPHLCIILATITVGVQNPPWTHRCPSPPPFLSPELSPHCPRTKRGTDEVKTPPSITVARAIDFAFTLAAFPTTFVASATVPVFAIELHARVLRYCHAHLYSPFLLRCRCRCTTKSSPSLPDVEALARRDERPKKKQDHLPPSTSHGLCSPFLLRRHRRPPVPLSPSLPDVEALAGRDERPEKKKQDHPPHFITVHSYL